MIRSPKNGINSVAPYRVKMYGPSQCKYLSCVSNSIVWIGGVLKGDDNWVEGIETRDGNNPLTIVNEFE